MQTTSEENRPKLSAVIIGRNEEQFIASAIESVLAVATRLAGVEVIFVDSASTDRSVEIASNFPIRVLQLRSDWPLCVAAGRYTGVRHAQGEYILFLDGDSEVGEDWLVDAVHFMDCNREYGGIAGVLNEEYVDDRGIRIGGKVNVRSQDLTRSKTDKKSLGGIALFRRLAIDEAGTVNPHLPTAEDHELCLRIRNCGFKLATIPGVMAIKYTEDRNTLHEIMRRSRSHMYDYGAVIRYCATYGRGWQFCCDAIPYVISFSATVMLFIVAVPVAYLFGLTWLLGAAFTTLIAAVVIKKRSFHRAILSVVKRAVSSGRTLVSFILTEPQPIDAYPTDVIECR